MMRARIERLLDGPYAVHLAAAASIVLGLFFLLVWAPHPWGWQGIDAYYLLAPALARGEPFATTDVPWGYAYFAATFYRLFGERVWMPLLAQVLLNATIPIMLYRIVRRYEGRRTAALAALITGVFSFNTVYASTQVSDVICSVLFMAAVVAFDRAVREQSLAWFAATGVLAGLMPQFRPNMILLPPIVALFYIALRPQWRRLAQLAAFGSLVCVMLSPWIVRNYTLTGLFMPTSTHGGVQFWYGTLQVGEYLESRSSNPRSAFERTPFDYTSLTSSPVLIAGELYTCHGRPVSNRQLIYWTDRDPTPTAVRGGRVSGKLVVFDLPPQPSATAIYYYYRGEWVDDRGSAIEVTTPAHGASTPFVAFVNVDHLRDMDGRADLLDVFDVIQMTRHLAWSEPLTHDARLDLNGDGTVDVNDLNRAVQILLPESTAAPQISSDAREAVATFSDGSRFAIPRQWSGLITETRPSGGIAAMLLDRSRTFAELSSTPVRDTCNFVDRPSVNRLFYRGEPNSMRRYMALAIENVKDSPGAFAAAAAYRFMRLFVIQGTSDVNIAQQFDRSRWVYRAATLLSLMYLGATIGGAIVLWRRRSPLRYFVLLILYVPVTICFVLTNMRYTLTVQPLMFACIAVGLVAALGWRPEGASESATRHSG